MAMIASLLRIWSGSESRAAVAALLALAVSAVQAGTTPPPPMMSYSDIFSQVRNDCDFSIEDELPQAFCTFFHPGSQTTNKDLGNNLNVISGNLNKAIGGRFGGGTALAMKHSGTAGMAAGDFGESWGWWVNYTRTNSDDTLSITKYDSTLDTVVGGIDTTIGDNIVIGVALIWENNDIETRFNGGHQDIDGFTGAPYVGWLINDNFSADATFGYGGFDVEQVRVNFNGNPANLVRGDTEQDRWFVAANLNGFTQVGNFILTGRIGILYTELETDAINEVDLSFAVGDPSNDAFVTPEQTTELGQVQFGGEVAWAAFALEPYASLYYINDFERDDIVLSNSIQPANDDDEVRGSIGARWFSQGGFSAFVEATFVGAREDFNSHAISALVRFDF